MDTRVPKLHWADYVVFVLFLASSAAIGVFYGYKSKKNAKTESTKSFLTGGGQMPFFPVGLSMMASFLSAIFVLGFPAEVYTFGITNLVLAISYVTGFGLAAHVHLPIYYRLGVTSGYEYLERRYNKAVRIAGAITFAVMVMIYLPVVLYTPALALAQVTTLPMVASILSVGAVCTFYTALGGMKATVWNDALQMTIMLVCFVIILAIGTSKVGNITTIFEIAKNGSRLTTSFDPNPFLRATFWSHSIGGTFVNLTLYASSQTIIQKFLSTKSIREGQKAVWFSSIVNAICLVMVFFLGIIVYAYYKDCDPVSEGRAAKSDQIVPLFVMEVMGNLHGLPGLFLATTFSAAISSVSGSLNALAAVFLEDLIRPAYIRIKHTNISARTGTIISRCLALFFGCLTVATSFLASLFGPTVIQIALSIFGMIGSPLMAILTLGMFVPWINSWGALSGLVVSLGITCWVGFGRIILQVPNIGLPMSTEGCPRPTLSPNLTTAAWATTTADDLFTTGEPPPERTWLKIYELSFMYYSVLALLVALVVAMPVSLLTGRNKGRHLDPRLFFSMSCCGKDCSCEPDQEDPSAYDMNTPNKDPLDFPSTMELEVKMNDRYTVESQPVSVNGSLTKSTDSSGFTNKGFN